MGDHLVPCTNNRLTQRRGGHTAQKEQALSDSDRSADILIHRWPGQKIAVDLTCVHHLRLSENVTTPQEAKEILKQAEDQKISKFEQRCSRVGWKLIPAVTHPLSGWTGKGTDLIRRILQATTKDTTDKEVGVQ